METPRRTRSRTTKTKTTCFQFVKRMNGNLRSKKGFDAGFTLLPIREAYEWKPKAPFVAEFSTSLVLLPIREAYEWKLFSFFLVWFFKLLSCFQFVKRMNGNDKPCFGQEQECLASCFQFVKRMNGNAVWVCDPCS